MTVLVDTSVLYAHHDRSAPKHGDAKRAMRTVLSGQYGLPIVTDYVYDETLTLTAAKIDPESAARLGRRIRGVGEFPEAIALRFLDEDVFDRAVSLFERLADQDLSFTDATIVAYARTNDVDHVLAFDDDFDGIVDRLDPADA